jgi:hypothetical protein
MWHVEWPCEKHHHHHRKEHHRVLRCAYPTQSRARARRPCSAPARVSMDTSGLVTAFAVTASVVMPCVLTAYAVRA